MPTAPSDRVSAILLLAAAAAGLAVAASPIGPALIAAKAQPLVAGLDAEAIVDEGLLAIFFLLVAVELRYELTRGALAHPASAAVPVMAAVGGVVAPAVGYLLLAPADAAGWPIPVATDIAFALGLLAVVGRRFPARVRAFLLALAIVDDLVAVLIIAIVLPRDLAPLWLVPAALLVVGFWALTGLRASARRAVALWAVGGLVWVCALQAGVQATLAAVACGLLLPRDAAARVDRALQPVSRLVVLPLFACVAGLVRIGGTEEGAGRVLLAVAVALPVGKLVGITVGGLIGAATVGRRAPVLLRLHELVAVGLLGGVGFTVSLLMAHLAFDDGRRDAATLGVLAGSAAAIVLAAAFVPLLARRR